MSRDLKFRAWIKPLKRYADYLEYDLNEGWVASIEEHPNITADDYHSAYFYDKKGEIILEQYIGLKDKNGREICEGDIIEQNGWPECRAVCYWDDSDASFDFTVIGGNDNPKSFIEEYEVVGNIHEGIKK